MHWLHNARNYMLYILSSLQEWVRKFVMFAGLYKPLEKQYSLCESVACIRCHNNVEIKKRAKNKLLKYANRMYVKNLTKSISYSPETQDFILYYPRLSSRPVWNYDDLPLSYQEDYRLLTENIDVILKEYINLKLQDFDGWSKFYLVNQGTKDTDNEKLCAVTYNIVKQCCNVMQGCLFGYVFFSVLPPNTTILKHRGPTNVRLRCHIALQIPNKNSDSETSCLMNVDGENVQWLHQKGVFFDDSFPHSVRYKTDSEDEVDRVVLLLDFWHPDLTSEERRCLQNCYSPLQ
ncbi:aspartate beta-hydroxylase domain-containing protein 2-like [Hydractinia symbiolongicarpus]|uniref:aspartate beta-hydroxylase domain-containing protein 2-like n=1 Tax=Hydractinia symbiolongicarpus TaxID=13093 RepID=UPI002549E3CB|nr:aspartate beta-hydroxylase domain-containing protein 2-like [Hydractinia symbiolongicarpus]